jgi:hypothetical protein
MQEAFGPHTSNQLDEKGYTVRPLDKQDKIVLWGCAIIFVVVMALFKTGII